MWVLAVTSMVAVAAMRMAVRSQQLAAQRAPAPMPPTMSADPEPTEDGIRIMPITTPPFSLTDQLGRTITNDSLKGHPWIAAFIFTNCASACPMISQQMSGLQKQIPDSRVALVSFTVDPKNDTPAVLANYAHSYHADNDRWRFLTGEPDRVFKAIRDMKVGFKPAAGDDPIMHDQNFILIDAQGRFRDRYNSANPADVQRLIDDANKLAGKLDTPAGGKS
jgi:cytochrome oxidase Cu insertion factor (SCO1/SenC/PrrC family)